MKLRIQGLCCLALTAIGSAASARPDVAYLSASPRPLAACRHLTAEQVRTRPRSNRRKKVCFTAVVQRDSEFTVLVPDPGLDDNWDVALAVSSAPKYSDVLRDGTRVLVVGTLSYDSLCWTHRRVCAPISRPITLESGFVAPIA
jgi:hypothetical protein